MAPDPLERVSPRLARGRARGARRPKPDPVVDTDHVAPIRASVRDAVETVLAAAEPGR